jgi:hypothetical protein
MSAITAGLNALANCSRTPVNERDVTSIITRGDGPGHLVRALFEDCSLETLQKISFEIGLSNEQLTQSYRIAKRVHHAANPDFDNALE